MCTRTHTHTHIHEHTKQKQQQQVTVIVNGFISIVSIIYFKLKYISVKHFNQYLLTPTEPALFFDILCRKT